MSARVIMPVRATERRSPVKRFVDLILLSPIEPLALSIPRPAVYGKKLRLRLSKLGYDA